MQRFGGSQDYLERGPAGPALGIGNFDGVHRGHQALLARLGALARACGGPATVLTFRPHPARVLRPELAPPLICTEDEERELLAAAGVEALVEEPFTRSLAAQEPAQFCHEVLGRRLRARAVVVGYNFRFGRGAAGTVADLQRWGAAQGVEVVVVERVGDSEHEVSSSAVRRAVLGGEVERAAGMLGRHFALRGQVVHGEARGRTLGFPTLNLAPETELLPADGIYAARVRFLDDGSQFGAAAYLGRRPTFGEGERVVEAYLLDGDGDFYGRPVALEFLRFLRPSLRFDGPDALRAAMAEDVQATRRALRDLPAGAAPRGAVSPAGSGAGGP